MDRQPSRLQTDLLPRLAGLIRAEHLAPGTRLAEEYLARRLSVSRTPVRAALRHLARRGVVQPRHGGGYVLCDPGVESVASAIAELAVQPPASGEADRLSLAITRDRLAGRLPDTVSERDLMRRYGASRRLLQQTLTQLSGVALLERKSGHGWAFLPTLTDVAARTESYRWRAIIEPAALLEPGYRLEPGWSAAMRSRHEVMLAAPWSETASLAFYEMNAAFHEGLAAGAGNRYLLAAVQQQNRLRRARNYDWVFGPERVQVNCREHLEILDHADAREMDVAAALLRRHLGRAAALRRPEPHTPADGS